MFLKDHVGTLASMDFFTVPSATFRLLYVLVILRHQRRCVVHFRVTPAPTAAWVSQQWRQAFPFETAPRSATAMGVMIPKCVAVSPV